jgi:DcuC family C4-dicarboxylate transporter
MLFLGPVLAVFFVGVVIYLLVKKYSPIAVLLFSGLVMLVVAYFLGLHLPKLKQPTGLPAFDFVAYIIESLLDTNASVGLVIMIISGFVAYMDKIGASDALVYLAMKPLSVFRKHPYILASLVVPLGQFLFISIPSAAGLGLLLMATIFPIIVNLGVSRVAAVSLITATTAFGIGPASAIALSAASVLELDITKFFFGYQIPMSAMLSAVLTVTYFFVNRHYDKKLPADAFVTALETDPKTEGMTSNGPHKVQLKAPMIYGLLPLLPLVLLLAFSDFIGLVPFKVKVDTNVAMLVGLLVALVAELIRTRDLVAVFKSLDVFWAGMGDIFKSVVVLIIAADIFSKGLISLGFIDGLLQVAQQAGLGGIGIAVVLTVMIFLASILMGSGNAAFFAFGPLVPRIAAPLGMPAVKIILPMSLAASMGRTVSPIAGVVVAAAALAKVTPVDVVKRNLIPFVVGLIVMLTYNFL